MAVTKEIAKQSKSAVSSPEKTNWRSSRSGVTTHVSPASSNVNWRAKSSSLIAVAPTEQRARAESAPTTPELQYRRQFKLTPIPQKEQQDRARSTSRSPRAPPQKAAKSWAQMWSSPPDSHHANGSLNIKPTKQRLDVDSNQFAPPPISSGTKPYGSGGPGGNLETRACEFFERAYGLNGREAENHYVLMQIIKAQVHCSDRAVQELLYGFSYSDKLEDLRAQVRLYPRKPEVIGNKNRLKAKRMEELDALARILDPNYKTRPSASTITITPSSPPLPHRVLVANQEEKQNILVSKTNSTFGLLPLDAVGL